MLASVKGHLRRHWRFHTAHLTLWLAVACFFAFGVFTGAQYVRYGVRGPHGPVTLKVPAGVAQKVAQALSDHRGSRSQAPAGTPASVLANVRRQDAALARRDRLPGVFPDAAPEQAGCVTRLVVNYSSRHGVAPHAFILHYTVSPNVPGWADVNAVVGLFDTPAFQASSNYVFDSEGHCAYIVRETDKAWTQAAANPFSISVEVIDTGSESQFLPAPALHKLAALISAVCARWQIPVQLGSFENGVLTRYGILDHDMLGVAGGGHHDIAPLVNGRFDHAAGLARVRQVIDAVRAYRAAPAPKPKPAWYRAASKLPPLWAWVSWRDHGHPSKLRPANIPLRVPEWWFIRYAVHVRGH